MNYDKNIIVKMTLKSPKLVKRWLQDKERNFIRTHNNGMKFTA